MYKTIQDLISVKEDSFLLNICSWTKKLQNMQFDLIFLIK